MLMSGVTGSSFLRILWKYSLKNQITTFIYSSHETVSTHYWSTFYIIFVRALKAIATIWSKRENRTSLPHCKSFCFPYKKNVNWILLAFCVTYHLKASQKQHPYPDHPIKRHQVREKRSKVYNLLILISVRVVGSAELTSACFLLRSL